MMFHTSMQNYQRAVFIISGGQFEVVDSHIYPEVTFTSVIGRFSMIKPTKDLLTRGYIALPMQEQQNN